MRVVDMGKMLKKGGGGRFEKGLRKGEDVKMDEENVKEKGRRMIKK
jgi:hypothetical protein